MMKIQTDEKDIILPLEDKVNIIVENDILTEVITCFTRYFTNKKKDTCAIYDGEGSIIRNKDIEFIYVPYGSLDKNEFIFKQKSELNTFLTNVMLEDERSFTSIERIRDEMFDLLTDKGIYGFKKIISKGIRNGIEIGFSGLDISSLVSMLEVNTSELTESEMYIIIYNVLMHMARGSSCIIVYIDIPVDEVVVDWLNILRDNIFVLVNSKMVEVDVKTDSLIKLGRNNEIERYEMNISELKRLLYLNHPVVVKNLDLQTEENLQFYQKFSDKDITYLFNFTSGNPYKPL